MKTLNTSQTVDDFPEGVQLWCKSRNVTVKGPRGTLRRSFKHLALSISMSADRKSITVQCQMGKRKNVACVRTVCTHIRNMIVGVTRGYEYKMKLVYAHFPISVAIENQNKTVELRNFLGEKKVRAVTMRGLETTVERGAKDEIIIRGNSIDDVSQSAANVQQICRVRNKDIRKFLDGCYVSEKGNVVQPEE